MTTPPSERGPVAVGLPAGGVLQLSRLDTTFLNVASARVSASPVVFDAPQLSIVFRSGDEEADAVARAFATAVAVIVYITPVDRFVSLIVPDAPTIMLWEAGEITGEDIARWEGLDRVCLLSVAADDEEAAVTTDGVRHLSVLPIVRPEDAVLGDLSGDGGASGEDMSQTPPPELLHGPRDGQTDALSETLLRFAEPVMPPEAYEDANAAVAVMRLCATIWNAALLGPDERRNPELPPLPDSPLVDGLFARKEAHFGDDVRVIGDVDMVEDDGGLVLRVGEAERNPWLD